jgi:hypothetical protein
MAEENVNPVETSASNEASLSESTFGNLSSISLQPEAEESEQVKEPSSDTPSDATAITEPNETGKTGETDLSDTSEENDTEKVEDTEQVTEEQDGRDKLPIPARNKLRSLEKLEKNLLTPFRDPNIPIGEAFKKLSEWMPTRADELAHEAATSNIAKYPNEWLSAILGSETTVESVKKALEGNADGVKYTQTLPDEVKGFADTPEAKEIIEELDAMYSDFDWRDPNNDEQILKDDLAQVKMFRSQIALDNARIAEIASLKAEVAGMKPQVDSIVEGQQAEFQRQIETEYQTSVKTYQTGIETEAFKSVFKSENLDISNDDDEITKDLKTVMQSQFKPYADGVPSRLDDFVSHKFSDREKLALVIQRVDKYHIQAAKLNAEAKAEKDKSKSAEKTTQATALMEHANSEKAVLTVLAKQAGKEFIQKENAPMKRALEEIQRLRKQLGGNLRTEIVGESSATNTPQNYAFGNLSKVSVGN